MNALVIVAVLVPLAVFGALLAAFGSVSRGRRRPRSGYDGGASTGFWAGGYSSDSSSSDSGSHHDSGSSCSSSSCSSSSCSSGSSCGGGGGCGGGGN